jgi:uncharacterized protein (DUF1778 family)
MKKENKTILINFRVTPTEYKLFKRKAQANNTTMSSLIISKVL